MKIIKCCTCKISKEEILFFVDNSKKTGRVSDCKECRKKYHKKWYGENKERLIKNTKEYKEKNKDKYKKYHLEYPLMKEFGLTMEQFNTMLEKQGGVCAICKGEEKSKRRMAVDHCHKTGKIRGILCSLCNRAIGLMKDDTKLLTNAIKYLKQNG